MAFLITVYKNDKLEFFKEAIESIVNQDYGFGNINIYLGIDGDLPDNTQNYIDQNKECFYNIVQNESNKGLAHTLNRLIEVLEDEEYIFRMDSDDICLSSRVKKQIEFMNKHLELDISGTNIEIIDEASCSTNQTIVYPTTHKECYEFFKKRDPLAHPSVVFRNTYFEKSGEYPLVRKNQDTLYWAKGFINGCKFGNLNEVHLMFRQSNDLFNRRGNVNELLILLKNRFRINNKLGYGIDSYIYATSYFILQLMPSFIKKVIYRRLRN
ncbi:glycosyltransferase [bacterium]|nr:glycosyltransferase [bacterium]